MSAPKHGDRDLAVTRLNGLLEIFQRQAQHDCALTELTARAAEFSTAEEAAKMLDLPDAELVKKGWVDAHGRADRRQLHVAIHASYPFQHMPGYLRMAHERSMQRLKVLPTGEGGGGAKLVVIPTAPGELPALEDDDE